MENLMAFDSMIIEEKEEKIREEREIKIKRNLRAVFLSSYRPLQEDKILTINQELTDLKSFNVFLNKAGIYPLKNVAYSYYTKLCGFKTPKKMYQTIRYYGGEERKINFDYDKLLIKFFKKYNKIKFDSKGEIKAVITGRKIILSYKGVSLIKTLTFRYNNQEVKK